MKIIISKRQAYRIKFSNSTPVLTGIQPIKITWQNVDSVIKSEIKKIETAINNGLICNALNKPIVAIKKEHAKTPQGKTRSLAELNSHVGYLPFVIPVLRNGLENIKFKQVDVKGGGFYHEITNRADVIIKGKKKRIGVSVIIVDKNNVLSLKYISVFKIDDHYMIKSALCSRTGYKCLDESRCTKADFIKSAILTTSRCVR